MGTRAAALSKKEKEDAVKKEEAKIKDENTDAEADEASDQERFHIIIMNSDFEKWEAQSKNALIINIV